MVLFREIERGNEMSKKERIEKFLRILKIEIEDIQHDISSVIDIYEDREEKGEITEYVFRENIGTLKREIIGVQQVLRSFETFDFEQYDDLDAMIQDVRQKMREKLEGAEYEKVLNNIIDRKIEKLTRYINET